MRVGCWLSVIEKKRKKKKEHEEMAFIVPSWLNERGGDGLGEREREEKGEEFTRNEN
jgi:hypothetical protein